MGRPLWPAHSCRMNLLADELTIYAIDRISDRPFFPAIEIANGIVVKAPTAVKDRPAAFIASLLRALETSIPTPTPSAILVPVHRIISGREIFRSNIVPPLFFVVGCEGHAARSPNNARSRGDWGHRSPRAELKRMSQPAQVFHDLRLIPVDGADELAANNSLAVDDVGFGNFESSVARRDWRNDSGIGSLPGFADG